MKQDDIQAPCVNTGSGYGYFYSAYLHTASFILRKLVHSLTGTGELFDYQLSVDTPGLGDGSVKVCICIPHNLLTSAGALPLLLVAEGGGFILGEPSDGELNDRQLCDKLGIIVISVEYAKSPRYPYPHALLQLYGVLEWALSPAGTKAMGAEIDPSRVAALGNSAGGNLVASLSLLLSFTSGPCSRFRNALHERFRLRGQVLLYPSTACHRSYRSRFEQADEEAKAKSIPIWAATLMEASYLPPFIDPDQIFFGPVSVDVELLKSLQPPPALVITAGLDCLKLEAQDYADKLKKAGIQVEEADYPDAIHGFSHYREGNKAYQKENVEDCWNRVIHFLARVLSATT